MYILYAKRSTQWQQLWLEYNLLKLKELLWWLYMQKHATTLKPAEELHKCFQIGGGGISSKGTVLSNFHKDQTHGTSENRNTGNSGWPRTVRTPQNIAEVHQEIAQNRQVNAHRNNLPHTSNAAFNRITWRSNHTGYSGVMLCYKEIFSLTLIIATGCWEDLHNSSQTLLLVMRLFSRWMVR